MKKIEKEIKKNSTELIESSLPEISSLDNIPTKAKNTRRLPFYLIPCGAALAVAAIMIPVLLKQQFAPINTVTSSSAKSHSSNNINNSHNYNNSSNNNTHNYVFDSYKPVFNNFNEVAYYSYFAFYQGSTNNNAQLQPRYRLMTQNEGNEDDVETPRRESYVDEYGRLHYPIPYDIEYTFSDFLYFEFDTSNNAFLEQRIGNGHIYGLSLQTNIFDETMLVLKNGDYFYSCLCNGSGSHYNNGPGYIEFSSHKTIEGFDVVKDSPNKRYLTLNFGPRAYNNPIDYETLKSINIEGSTFTIDSESVFYDQKQICCGLDELKQRLGYNPDFEIVDEYGGPDVLVYDSGAPETNTFTLDEFEGTFSVSEDKLYLNETEIIPLDNANKIYASEINKDGHRDLVFESLIDSTRVFNIYDVENNKYLYHSYVSTIGNYDYYLDMRNDRLVVNVFKPGLIDNNYLLDYGYFAYGGNAGTTIAWQNLFELSELRLKGVFEADGETPVVFADNHYRFASNTSYIIEIRLFKYSGNTNPAYPVLEHQVECSPSTNVDNMPNQSPTWNFLSMENGIYRYQISFQERGYSYYTLSFYRFHFNFNAAVDEPVVAE